MRRAPGVAILPLRLAHTDPTPVSASLDSADSFDEAAQLFLQRTRHTRTGSPHTLRAYRADLRHFGAFLVRNALCFDALRRGHTERYLAELADAAQPRTVRRRVSCVRSFYRHARRLELVQDNPFDALDLPAVDRMSETHKVWSEAEVETVVVLLRAEVRDAQATLLAATSATRLRDWRRLFYAARRRALFVVLLTAGLRRAEAAGLGGASLVAEADGFTLTVRGKGSKVRHVPLAGFAYPALSDWLVLRRQVPTTSDALFLSDAGLAMRPRAVYRACRWINRRVDVRHALHPHLCRRTFATHQLAATGDLRAVQEVLGHASVATTQIYTHVDTAAMRRAVEAAGLARSEQAAGPLISL